MAPPVNGVNSLMVHSLQDLGLRPVAASTPTLPYIRRYEEYR